MVAGKPKGKMIKLTKLQTLFEFNRAAQILLNRAKHNIIMR